MRGKFIPMSIILHIGHSKTGSSAIQILLARNADLLALHGYIYPSDDNFLNAKKGYISSGNYRAFYNINSYSDSRRYVYSGEAFFRDIGNKVGAYNYIYENRLKIEKIILYTRDLFEHCCSSWGQRVKRDQSSESLSSYACKYTLYNRVMRTIKNLEALNVNYCIYNYSRHKKDISCHFIESMIEDKDKVYEMFRSIEFISHRVNRSLSVSEYEFQRVMNLNFPFPVHRFISDKLVNELPEIQSSFPKITAEAAKKLRLNNEAQAALLNEKLSDTERVSCHVPENMISTSDDEEFVFNREQILKIAEGIRGLVEFTKNKERSR